MAFKLNSLVGDMMLLDVHEDRDNYVVEYHPNGLHCSVIELCEGQNYTGSVRRAWEPVSSKELDVVIDSGSLEDLDKFFLDQSEASLLDED